MAIECTKRWHVDSLTNRKRGRQTELQPQPQRTVSTPRNSWKTMAWDSQWLPSTSMPKEKLQLED
ncbi:hypothetical protein SAY87_001483 [Trapa incisa]|uniref:Uncharacterized protein n=1 Tax=Trapa incisa TaxID=236973 RepID=A0AAN7JHF8_9MYRT|nr:hypothetical protein SAY87_001483 [Trapa incisa]